MFTDFFPTFVYILVNLWNYILSFQFKWHETLETQGTRDQYITDK